jgi:metal iron transporter
MNCPSPVHHPEGDGMNQNPNALSPALTTNEDLNGMANLKVLRRLSSIEHVTEDEPFDESDPHRDKRAAVQESQAEESQGEIEAPSRPGGGRPRKSVPRKLIDVVVTFGKFVGPGFMVSSQSCRAGKDSRIAQN